MSLVVIYLAGCGERVIGGVQDNANRPEVLSVDRALVSPMYKNQAHKQ